MFIDLAHSGSSLCNFNHTHGTVKCSVQLPLLLSSLEPSGTPNSIQITIFSSTSIEVRWLPPDFIDQNGVITGYTVILTNMETGTSHEYNTSASVTVQHIEGKLMFR